MSMGRAYFGRRKNGMEPLAGTAQFLEQVFNRYENLEIEQEGVFMGYFFSEPVERALKYIYYEMGSGRGQEGFRLLEQAAEELCRAGETWVMDLKEQLQRLNLEDQTPVYDAGVAAYLLNPLKDSYAYDDLARDFLQMTVPSRTDLLGKELPAEAVWRGEEKGTACACYMGYTAWKAGPVLREKLEETGMYALFADIEMPLIYSLHHMEAEGIHVEQKELKEYGDRLKVRIRKLEKEIYEQVGEEFNINSPKQLGEILFEKMKLKGGKMTNTAYTTPANLMEKMAP